MSVTERTVNIVEVFERFLDERGMVVPNFEKVDALCEAEDPKEIANIYGSDYCELEDAVRAEVVNAVGEEASACRKVVRGAVNALLRERELSPEECLAALGVDEDEFHRAAGESLHAFVGLAKEEAAIEM